MATIDRRKGGYRARVRIKNFPTQTATFPTLRDARRWATATEAAMRERRYFPATGHTLNEAIERYCTSVLPHKSAAH